MPLKLNKTDEHQLPMWFANTEILFRDAGVANERVMFNLFRGCTFHDGCKQGINQQIFNRKSISRKITHPQSWKLPAKLTGEALKG